MKKCKVKKKISVQGDVRVCAYGNVHTLLSKMPCTVMGLHYQCPFFLGRSQPFK